MPGFQRVKIEKDIYLWTPTTIRVQVRFPGGKRSGKGFALPEGYTPRFRAGQAILDGAATDVYQAACRERDRLWGQRKHGRSDAASAEDAAHRTTLSETFELMMARGRRKNLRPDTLRGYGSHWPPIEKAFGSMPLMALDTMAIEVWLDRRLKKVSAQTVVHERQLLILTFNTGIRLGLYPYANPAARTDPIPVPVKEGRRLSDTEYPKLLAACQGERRDDLWYRVFATLLLTGLRAMEVRELRWEDFDWAKRVLVPSHQKSSRRRDALTVSPELVEVLTPIRKSSGLVFPGRTGMPLEYKTVLRALKRIAKKAGIKDHERLGLHATRRTAITQAERSAKGNMTALLQVARHGDYKTTLRYLPTVSEDAKKVSLATSKAIGRTMGLVVPFRSRKKAA